MLPDARLFRFWEKDPRNREAGRHTRSSGNVAGLLCHSDPIMDFPYSNNRVSTSVQGSVRMMPVEDRYTIRHVNRNIKHGNCDLAHLLPQPVQELAPLIIIEVIWSDEPEVELLDLGKKGVVPFIHNAVNIPASSLNCNPSGNYCTIVNGSPQ